MRVLEFLVPDALLASAESARELLWGLSLPHVEFVAARAAEHKADAGAIAGSFLMPWQRWLLARDETGGQEPNLAEAWARILCPAASVLEESCWLIEPVHLQVGLDRVTLFDPALLDLSAQESSALAEAARPVLESDGWRSNAASPQRWLVSRPGHSGGFDLHGAAIERAIGQGVEQWLPCSEREADIRAWRRTSNEIQMIWFAHPVNAARDAAGKLSVNGLWLSGNGKPASHPRRYSKVVSGLPIAAALPIDPESGAELETFDRMTRPTRDQDWAAMREAVQDLDFRLGEILGEVRRGERPALRLMFAGEHNLRDLTVRRSDFWKFWRRGRADELLAEAAK